MAVLFCTIVYAWFFVPEFFLTLLGRQIVAASGFAANIYFWFTTNYFSPYALDRAPLNLWSLGVEEQFYVAWPLMVWLLLRVDRKLAAALLLGATVLSYLYCLYCTFTDQTQAFYSPATRFWELSIRGIVAFAGRYGWRIPKAELLSTIGAIMVGTFFAGFVRGGVPAIVGLPIAVGTALVIHGGRDAFPNRILSWNPAVAVGLISYPLYLWHWPVLSFAYLANFRAMPFDATRGVLVVLIIVLAVLTYFVVERKFRKSDPWKLVVAMAGVAAAAIVVSPAAHRFDRPVKHDPAQQLIAVYAELHQTGLGDFYREECDFTRWGSLMAVDSGHLSAEGSLVVGKFIAKRIWPHNQEQRANIHSLEH